MCGYYDDDDFVAEQCCACTLGNSTDISPDEPAEPECTDHQNTTDSGGDGCDWYYGNEDSCGQFDDDDFLAYECCACGGIPVDYCTEYQNTTDSGGDGCDWYFGNEGSCGLYDDEDFLAFNCCACEYPPSGLLDDSTEDDADYYPEDDVTAEEVPEEEYGWDDEHYTVGVPLESICDVEGAC